MRSIWRHINWYFEKMGYVGSVKNTIHANKTITLVSTNSTPLLRRMFSVIGRWKPINETLDDRHGARGRNVIWREKCSNRSQIARMSHRWNNRWASKTKNMFAPLQLITIRFYHVEYASSQCPDANEVFLTFALFVPTKPLDWSDSITKSTI